MDFWTQLRRFKKVLNIEKEKIITPELLEEMKNGRTIMYDSWEVQLIRDFTAEENEEFKRFFVDPFGFTNQSERVNKSIVIPKYRRGWRLAFGPAGIPFFQGAKLEGLEGYTLHFDLPMTEEEEKQYHERLSAFFMNHENQ